MPIRLLAEQEDGNLRADLEVLNQPADSKKKTLDTS